MTPLTTLPGRRRKRRPMVMTLVAALLAMLLGSPIAHAWPEGVYISGSAYFTLEQVSYSTGSDNGLLKFNLKLHNGGGQDVDFNYYGARVTDSQGRSYTATQLGTANARVLPGKEQAFTFTARTANSLKAGDLSVTLFQWDYSEADYMRDLGSLSVAAALKEAGLTAAPEASVDLSQADSALAAGSTVLYQLSNSYTVHEAGGWNVYADLTLTNKSSGSLTLPAALKYRLTNVDGQLFNATVAQGGDQPILPGASRKLILKAPVSEEAMAAVPWTLELYKGEADAETLLGTLGLTNASTSAAIGAEQALTGADGKKQLAATVLSAQVTTQGDQMLVQANVRITNPSSKLATLPAYSAQVQLDSAGLSAAAVGSGNGPAYLAAQGSADLTFHAVLPADTPVADLQFVLFEPSGTNTLPVLLADLAQATPQTGVVGKAYTIGDPLQLQASQLVDSHLQASLMDFRLYESVTNGYKTAVAKFKLTNTGTSTIAIPTWNTELIDEAGLVYSGSVIKPASTEVAPNTSYMLTFSYLVPESIDGQPYTIHLYDGKTAAPAKLTLAAYKVDLQTDPVERQFSLYPYEATVKDFSLFYAFLNKTYTFKFNVDMELGKKDQLLVDAASSKLEFLLVDADGYPVATQTLAFDAIRNGSQSIQFTNDTLSEFSNVYHILVYDRIETGTSSLRRLLADLKSDS